MAAPEPTVAGPAPRPEAALSWPAIGASLAVYVVHVVASVIALGLVELATGGGTENDVFYRPWSAAAIIVGYSVLVAATLVAARRLDPRAVADVLGFHRTAVGRAVGLVIASYLLVTAANVVVLQPIFHTTEAQGLDPDPFPGGPAAAIGFALTAVGFVVAAPVGEELFFRGLLQRALGGLAPGRAGVLGAAVGAAVFACAHFQPGAIPALFLLGLALAWLRRTTGSIWPAIGLHALNNGAATVALFATAWS